MIFSVQLALTAMLAGSALSSALPGKEPASYPAPPAKYPTAPVHHRHTTKCHLAYTTLHHVTSKPHPTVLTKYETKTIPHTKEITSSKIVYDKYTTRRKITTHSSKTVAAEHTHMASTTKTVEKEYQCPATTYKIEKHTRRSTGESRYKTSSCITKTYPHTHTDLISGYKTKTKESVHKTYVPYTHTTSSACTDPTTSTKIYTSNKLETKTFTSIWTEVHTIPEVHTTRVTKNHVHLTTKTIVTSKPTYITHHYTTKIPWTHKSVITKLITSTIDVPSWGTHTWTKTHVHTKRVPHVYKSTCSSHHRVVHTFPVVHTRHRVETYPVTKLEPPCTETKTRTETTHFPSVWHKTSVYKTSCTETAYVTYTAKTVKSHEVCKTVQAVPTYGHRGW